MKIVDITPVFETKYSLKKENYRPVSVLNAISKVFKKPLEKPIRRLHRKTVVSILM